MQQQLTTAAPQDVYYTSRSEALHNVEATIVELGGIFQQLAHMVWLPERSPEYRSVVNCDLRCAQRNTLCTSPIPCASTCRAC